MTVNSSTAGAAAQGYAEERDGIPWLALGIILATIAVAIYIAIDDDDDDLDFVGISPS